MSAAVELEILGKGEYSYFEFCKSIQGRDIVCFCTVSIQFEDVFFVFCCVDFDVASSIIFRRIFSLYPFSTKTFLRKANSSFMYLSLHIIIARWANPLKMPCSILP